MAVFVWPPDDQNVLRKRTAELCDALGTMLDLRRPAPGEPDPLVAMTQANTALRTAFRATASRPVALSTGSRLLVRLVDELEWLTTTVVNACAEAPEHWPEQGRQLRGRRRRSCTRARRCSIIAAPGRRRPDVPT